MNNLKNEIEKSESSEDSLLLYKSNILQIKLADELGYSLEEFINYFSYQFRRLFENNLNKSNPLKTNWEELYWLILTHFVRNNYKIKIKQIIEF